MIDKRAVAEYLKTPRDDFSFLKTVDTDDLRRQLDSMHPAPDTSSLTHCQLVGLLVGIFCGSFAYWYGMGLGKTLMVLRLLDYWWRAEQLRKAMVLVPSIEGVGSWAEQIREWDVRLPYIELDDGSSVEKAGRLLGTEAGLILVAYPSLSHMVSRRETEEDKNENLVTRLRPNRAALQALCKGLGASIYDESTEAANTTSILYRECRAISKRVQHRITLAGRPFGRDPFSLWPQMFLVDHGESLGLTEGLFREAFYTKKQKFFGGPRSYDYTFRKAMEPVLARLRAHRSIHYLTKDCVDLPPRHRIVRRIRFPAETLEYYERVKKHLVAARGDRQVVWNDFLRMRQLGSGFLGVADDKAGATAHIEFSRNPKLEDIVRMIQQRVPAGDKVVIFHEFIYSGRRISAALRRAGIKHGWLYGGTKDRKGTLSRFKEDLSQEVLVLAHQLGAYVLNLQVANWFMYYESPIGCIDRDQSEFRGWRPGQTKDVWLVDFDMIGGAEEKIRAFHAEGSCIFAALSRDPGAVFGAIRPRTARAKKRPKKAM